jgi:acyl-CoA synthetase (AMP-forming)/AMP-acid ligase II
MSSWNFAEVWETIAQVIPEAPALRHGETVRSWRQMNASANSIGRFLAEVAGERQAKVAHYLYNCSEYLESLFGIFKAALVPVNTNYRYGPEELAYLWDNSDSVAVIFHGAFTDKVDALRPKMGHIKAWIYVEDGSGPCPDWAVDYREIASGDEENYMPSWGRSPDDLYILYTGGTTGMPKGVMWRQDDLFCVLNSANFVKWPEDGTVEDIRKGIKGPGPVHLAACPLMHGTGAFTSFAAMMMGGCIVTLTKRSFDPVELLDTVQAFRVNSIAIVGDAFARPILETLDANPGRWDISSLFAIISSGVMWSEQVKKGLLKHHPNMILVDSFGSSEGVGFGTSVSSAAQAERTGKFRLGDNAILVDDDLKPIEPAPGKVGKVAVKGHIPLGYYKDEEKTRRTFPVIDGVRYSVPGDYAEILEDGSIRLLGRGSVCINTGGEKVYPEEVEEVLKLHEAVHDAAAVGVPDERFGEVVAAVVEPVPGKQVSAEELIQFVKGRLAGYKAPKFIHFVPSLERAPNGKLDYNRWRREVAKAVGRSS